MKVAVGSTNPVKIQSVVSGFRAYWPELSIEVEGFDVPSGISNQPLSDDETIRGATNRAYAALAADKSAAFGVGVEGGMQERDGTWSDAQWVVIINKAGKVGLGQSIRIPVPDLMMQMIHDGKELGDVIDEVFKKKNMKQAGGYINEVTHGLINREQMCYGAVVSALIPFTNPDLFEPQ